MFQIDQIISNNSATESFCRIMPDKISYKEKKSTLNRLDILSRRQTLVCIPDNRMISCRLATPAEYSCWYLVSTSRKSIDPPNNTSHCLTIRKFHEFGNITSNSDQELKKKVIKFLVK